MLRPPKYTTIAKLALALPGVHETYFHGPWFKVGKKGFALWWNSTESWIFKLPHDQQRMLFDARPDTFSPMISGRLIWSYVEVENLSTAELRDFLESAWRNVAPKKLQALSSPAQRGRWRGPRIYSGGRDGRGK
jgi:hypothetical protein